jgi:uncharacterized delta-60 repeat protein
MNTILRGGVRLALSCCLLAGGSALAGLGFPDSTFGSGGVVVTDFAGAADQVNAVIAFADGGTLAAGSASFASGHGNVKAQLALTRYLASGALDQAFGSGGRVTTPIGANSSASAVAIDPEGRIVAAGQSCSDHLGGKCKLALVRTLANGALDPTFGSGGIVTLSLGGKNVQAAGVAVLSDGKIVAGGRADESFVAARVNPNGVLDASFGTGGTTKIGFDRAVRNASGFLVTSDGYVMLAGAAAGTDDDDFAVACLDAAGQPETEFAGTGRTVAGFGGGNDSAHAIARAADGGFFVGGMATMAGRPSFAILKYRENGTLDAAFGNAGRALVDFGASSQINALAVLPTGTLVAAGTFQKPSGASQVALAFLKGDGSLDADFGDAGLVKTDLAGAPSAFALAVAPLGKLVAGGTATVNGQQDFALLRWIASRPGDADWNGWWDVADVFRIIDFAYAGGKLPAGYADATGDGRIDIVDIFRLIDYLFAGGPAPQF